MMIAPLPIAQLAKVIERENLKPRFVLTDIDDTLTIAGKITASALDAMEQLANAGIACIAVTGRPAGWCDHIARMWPVEAVVGENGAFYFRYDAQAQKVVRRYAVDAEARASHREQLRALEADVLATVPGVQIASDQDFRIADLAIDYAEDVGPLGEDTIEAILTRCAAHGATAKVSSIHVNTWYGDYDKSGMLMDLLQHEFGVGPDEARRTALYIGDSPNDEPLFKAFPLSVGVANIAPFMDRFDDPPRFVCTLEEGNGFAEMAELLIKSCGTT
jgi:HAD superfamily hydrolase (TIGR01484 family)